MDNTTDYTDNAANNINGATEFHTSYYKGLAKSHLTGKYLSVIGHNILIGIVQNAITFLPTFIINFAIILALTIILGESEATDHICSIATSGTKGLIGMLVSGIFTMGFISIAMAVVEGRKPAISDAFAGFKMLGKSVGAGLLTSIYLGLWSLLIIPAFIKPWSYSATFYLLRAHPDMGVNEAITRSCELMDGHKWEAFVLSLSFFGWWLLVIITLGIAALYVGPYTAVTYAEFYNKLVIDYDARRGL